MDSSKPISVTSAKDFFELELRQVFLDHHVSTRPHCFDYLVNLLVKYIHSERFFIKTPEGKLENNVLAELYANFLDADLEHKRMILQRLGDVCMIVTGFFSDSFKRKLVDIDYYSGMGGLAYWTLADHSVHEAKKIYQELSQKFKPISNAIHIVSERGGLQTNTDILRLYEKWLLTGSEHLKGLLNAQGILPLQLNHKLKH